MIKKYEYAKERFIEYSDFGTNYKKTLIVNHGILGSVKNKEFIQKYLDNQVRVISIARVGYGDSSFIKLNNYLDFSKIVEQLLNHLEVNNCSVLGISAGAAHSYALAYHLKSRLDKIFIYSGIPATYKEEVLNSYKNAILIKEYYSFFKNENIIEITRKLLELYTSYLDEKSKKSYEFIDSTLNEKAIGQEAKLQSNFWGFNIEDIQQEIYLQHSENDEEVPIEPVRKTIEYLKNKNFIELKGYPHISKESFLQFQKLIIEQI